MKTILWIIIRFILLWSVYFNFSYTEQIKTQNETIHSLEQSAATYKEWYDILYEMTECLVDYLDVKRADCLRESDERIKYHKEHIDPSQDNYWLII